MAAFDPAESARSRRRRRLRALASGAAACAFLLVAGAAPANAASNKVRVTNLADLAFGTLANVRQDAVQSESVCLYADTATNAYHVTATGTGPGGAFQLSSGASVLPFEVQWSSAPGESTGAQLSPNTPLTGQVSAATQQTCNNGPASTASLIVVLRSGTLSSATAGSYNGTLTLVVGAE